jgi:hypothetical protein
LRQAGFGAGDPLRAMGGWEDFARVTLLKTGDDQGRAIEQLAQAPGQG